MSLQDKPIRLEVFATCRGSFCSPSCKRLQKKQDAVTEREKKIGLKVHTFYICRLFEHDLDFVRQGKGLAQDDEGKPIVGRHLECIAATLPFDQDPEDSLDKT